MKVGTVVSVLQLGSQGTETMTLFAMDECFAVQMLLLIQGEGFCSPCGHTWASGSTHNIYSETRH